MYVCMYDSIYNAPLLQPKQSRETTVHVRRRCGLLSNYSDHLLLLLSSSSPSSSLSSISSLKCSHYGDTCVKMLRRQFTEFCEVLLRWLSVKRSSVSIICTRMFSNINITATVQRRRKNKQVIKVIWHKAASPPHTDGSVVFFRWRQCAPHI